MHVETNRSVVGALVNVFVDFLLKHAVFVVLNNAVFRSLKAAVHLLGKVTHHLNVACEAACRLLLSQVNRDDWLEVQHHADYIVLMERLIDLRGVVLSLGNGAAVARISVTLLAYADWLIPLLVC